MSFETTSLLLNWMEMGALLLIARHPQIHGWVDDPVNAAIVGRLVSLIVSKPTLMLGLSAQDANILNIFNRAHAQLAWNWPGDRPAYVFAENDLGADQKGLLECVYKEAFYSGDPDSYTPKRFDSGFCKTPSDSSRSLRLVRETKRARRHCALANARSRCAGSARLRSENPSRLVGRACRA